MSFTPKYLLRRAFATGSAAKEENLDFVQQLFLQNVREYFKKLKENNGKLFDMMPELEAERLDKVNMLTKSYAGDMSEEEFQKFPTFTFKEPELDGINLDDKKPTKTK